MLHRLLISLITAFAFTIAVPAHARDAERGSSQADAWDLLGQQSVDAGMDRDVITVGTQEGTYTRLRLEARNNDIYLYSIKVLFGSGEEQTVRVNELIRAGGRSGILDLTGGRRGIRTVTLLYKARAGVKGRTALALYGERSQPGSAYSSAEPTRSDIIAEETYDRRSDRINFRLPPRGIRSNELRLKAIDEPLSLESIEVRFSNGRSETISVYDRIAMGEESRAVRLNVPDRVSITGVTVIKRPSWRPGQGRVDLLGSEPGRPQPSHGAEIGRAPPGWVLFGAKTVDFGLDRDVIPVGTEVGRFSRISLAVRDNAVFLREITLVYGSGQRDTRIINTSIPANSRTRPLDIPGDRFIKQIEMVYQSRPDFRSSRAVVEVFGEYDRNWFAGNGYQSYNRGWLMLGAHRAQMFATDTDAFEVGEQFGRYRAIRLTVRRHAVRVTGIRVTYGNGQVEEIPLFQELLDGQSTRDIDLQQRERYIKRVDVRYRTKLNFKGEGLVELWGLR